MYSFSAKIDFDSASRAKSFYESIQPELGEEFSRSKTTISIKNTALEVIIKAGDKGAMRASLNSFTKPLFLFLNLEEI